MGLRDKTAIVTGGSRGIGQAVAMALANAGADVVVADVDLEAAEQVAAEIRNLGRKALAVKANVSDAAGAAEMVQAAINEFGKVDILVNNAGITRDTLLMRMKEEDWDAVLNVNLKGVFNCTKAVISSMMKQRYGRIVNIASVVGIIGNAGQANYASAKAGMIGFTKSVAREVASRNITVNAVAPGFIQTQMTDVLPDNVKAKLMEQIPMGRLGQPEDIANAVVFLASDAAGYITGQTISVNGGMVMQ
ncbi:MAG: 3-oxoacyl-[acyl-carrier-protein] reductase [Bacillota bacterium]